jgi:ABC-type transport system substrate-binding protein
MDYLKLDKVRRSTTPLQLDVVEAFARGRLSRRQFIQKATVLGLSGGAIAAVIAACGGSSPSTAASAGASAPASAGASAPASAGASGGSIKVAVQRPVTLDPVAMQDLASYGLVAQSMEFLATLSADASDIAPGLAESWSPPQYSTLSLNTWMARLSRPRTT